MLNEDEVIKRLTELCMRFDQDDYDEWAIDAIPVYQAVLDDAGMTAFTVVGGHPNDGNLDCIGLRAPWGEESTFPDPEWIERNGKTTYTKYIVKDDEKKPYVYIQQLVKFFMDLIATVKFLNRTKNMREAISYLEAAVCAHEPTVDKPNPAERDRCLHEALRHISAALMTVTIDGQRFVKKVMVENRERLGVHLEASVDMYWNEEQKEWRRVVLVPKRVLGPVDPDDPRLIAAKAGWKEVE